jgi:glycosyltransferase involved in cell wall biosynthesis
MPRNNNNMLKVSIVLCSYNGEKYISDQVESILNQTYSNFELIISDDCSSDTTVSILRRYEKLDSRVKVIENSMNVGLAKNFERGLMMATGEYIAMSDQDDYWLPTKIESQTSYLEQHEGVGLIFHDSLIVEHDLKESSGSFLEKIGIRRVLLNYIRNNWSINIKFLLNENCVQGATMFFRSDLKKYLIPIPENVPFVDVWVSLVTVAVSRITYVDEMLIKYRQHNSNTIGASARGLKFYIERLKSRRFAQEYLINGRNYALILNEILRRGLIKRADDVSLIIGRLKCLRGIINFLEKERLSASLLAVVSGFWHIVSTRQYKNILVLGYFCINRLLTIRRAD